MVYQLLLICIYICIYICLILLLILNVILKSKLKFNISKSQKKRNKINKFIVLPILLAGLIIISVKSNTLTLIAFYVFLLVLIYLLSKIVKRRSFNLIAKDNDKKIVKLYKKSWKVIICLLYVAMLIPLINMSFTIIK